MATLEERVAVVETQSDAHARAIEGLRAELAAVRSEMATRNDIAALRAEMADLRRDMMAGDAALRAEITELRADMNRRFDVMDQKFLWLAGTQVATLLAVVGVLAGALYR
ncbi:MAG: hypothetical protein HYY76_01975 [Acidobacteria bacterium]|nr:hypothetical protein [Acidobacteriota bacterium]